MGTGLGLSIVYGFAKQSEGHLKIDFAPTPVVPSWVTRHPEWTLGYNRSMALKR